MKTPTSGNHKWVFGGVSRTFTGLERFHKIMQLPVRWENSNPHRRISDTYLQAYANKDLVTVGMGKAAT